MTGFSDTTFVWISDKYCINVWVLFEFNTSKKLRYYYKREPVRINSKSVLLEIQSRLVVFFTASIFKVIVWLNPTNHGYNITDYNLKKSLHIAI